MCRITIVAALTMCSAILFGATPRGTGSCLLSSESISFGSLSTGPSADDNAKPEDPALATVKLAEQFYDQGKFQEAVEKYQVALKVSANLEAAQSGLALSLLAADRIDEALEIAIAGWTAHPDSSPLLRALGDVRFRRGEMADAEQAYRAALQIDVQNAKAWIGLARLYSAFSLYGQAYTALVRAHQAVPNDPEVQLLWLETLPRSERVPALRKYLTAPGTEYLRDRDSLQDYLKYLDATAEQPPHPCMPVTRAEETETKLQPVWGDYFVHGLTLEVKINGQSHRLLLDTGASGITISRRSAEKAGLKRIPGEVTLSGIGDQGPRTGYLAIADRILIGGLEFRDCMVTVSDKKALPDVHGLIGADVFGSYLIDIDLPAKVLKLSALPRRPGETASGTALRTEDESETRPVTVNLLESISGQVPTDRYIAPEMSDWVRIFRFDHLILLTGQVNDSKPLLFLLDTGAEHELLSSRTAGSITKLKTAPWIEIKGASGAANKVYRAYKIKIQSGGYYKEYPALDAVDLSKFSSSVGTTISGILGFDFLSRMEVRIDYRDGLIKLVHR